MPSLVVDASAAIKWLNPHEALADKASALYADYAQGQFSLLVPAFWDYEVVNGVNKAVARGDLTEQEGQVAYLSPADNAHGSLLDCLRGADQPVVKPCNAFSAPRFHLLARVETDHPRYSAHSSSCPTSYWTCGCRHGGTR